MAINIKFLFNSVLLIWLLLATTIVCAQKSIIDLSKNKLKLTPINRLVISGDFNGDKVIDTLSNISYSNNLKQVIDSLPSLSSYEIDTIQEYIYTNCIALKIRSNNKLIKPISLGKHYGLYALVNVGDLNNDGADDIAFVIDYMDFSMSNTCKIYSYNKGWKNIFSFHIHEDVFENEKAPDFTKSIPRYLEKINNVWHYNDYLDMLYDKPEDVGKMMPIKIKK